VDHPRRWWPPERSTPSTSPSDIIQGVTLQTVNVNPPSAATSPAEQLSTVLPGGVAYVLVTFIET
jgi:hypothetical protein